MLDVLPGRSRQNPRPVRVFSNLEVGDPLSGSEAPRIVMPNGFTYHLQELAFFSWFYQARSLGVHGWFSDNGTFLSNAGPVCQ